MKPSLPGTSTQKLFVLLSICYGFLSLTTQWHTIKEHPDHWGNLVKCRYVCPDHRESSQRAQVEGRSPWRFNIPIPGGSSVGGLCTSLENSNVTLNRPLSPPHIFPSSATIKAIGTRAAKLWFVEVTANGAKQAHSVLALF